MFKQLLKYGQDANSHDITKAIAGLLMIIDHLFLFTHQHWQLLVGRLAAPLFFFLVGYSKAYRWQTRLFVYGILLVAIQGWLLTQLFYLNILLTFIIIRAILLLIKNIPLDRQLLFAIFIAANLLNGYIYSYVEYGTLGLMVAMFGLFIREKRPYAIPWGIATLTSYCVTQIIVFDFQGSIEFTSCLVLFIGLGFVLCRYKPRIWRLPAFLRWPTLFMSRYSLPIYFYHLSLLLILAYLVHNQFAGLGSLFPYEL